MPLNQSFREASFKLNLGGPMSESEPSANPFLTAGNQTKIFSFIPQNQPQNLLQPVQILQATQIQPNQFK